jgi:hypothetical protein
MDAGTLDYTVPAGEPLAFNTDNGEVRYGTGLGTRFLRNSWDGAGLDGGIFYAQLASSPGGGAALGVFVFRSLTVPATSRIEASGGRALVILATNDITIEGVVDVSSNDINGGPGAGDGGQDDTAGNGDGRGRRGAGDGGNNDSGGGGAGFGSSGGARGRLTDGGGGTYGDPLCVPLIGGSGGGGGGDNSGGDGGGGGGAVQLSAGGTLRVTGTIDAGGGGGSGGNGSFDDTGAGGGGGSGGAILLEGARVIGSGCMSNANDGADGDTTTVPAPPTATSTTGGGGGAGSDATGSNGANGAAAENGGGGGGGAGRIRLNARDASYVDQTGATITPMGALTTTGSVAAVP